MGRVREAQQQKGSVAPGELLSYYAPMAAQMQVPPGTRSRHQALDLPTTSYAQLAWPPKGPSPEDGAAKLDERQYGRNCYPPRSMPSAVALDNDSAPRSPARQGPEESPPTAANPSDVLLVDLGSRSLLQEDLEKALRLWTRPSILIAGRNSLDRLPANVPGTILYLDLSWNRLASLEGFAALPILRELDVSHNSVQDMLGLVSNADLRVLRISHNRIRRIEGIHQLRHLEEADFSHNLLKTKVDVRALSLNAALRRLRIEGNPYCSTGVQHGTYQIALQHLLPGMSLLDGKPPPVLSLSLSSTMPLPPPPRPPAPGKPADHHRLSGRRGPHRTSRGPPSSCSPDRRGSGSIREGFMASSSLDFVGDLSVERRWRDSAVAGRSLYPQFAPNSHQRAAASGGVGGGTRVRGSGDGDGGRGREPCIKVTTGGGGPTVAPGSYAEIFVAALRKEGSTLRAVVDDPAAAAATATAGVSNSSTLTPMQKGATAAAATTTKRQQQQQPPGHSAAAQAPNGETAVAAAAAHRRGKRRNPAAGADTVPGGGASAPASAASASLLSYRGLSRAERGAARREAWSQARREGAVGDGKMQGQRTSYRQRTSAPGVGVGDNVKNRRALGVRSLEPTTRSARRRTPAAAAPSRRPRQAAGGGGDQAFETDGSAGGVGGASSSPKLSRGGAADPRSSSRNSSGSNARGGRRLGGEYLAKPGATRQPVSISNSRRRQTPSTASRGATVPTRGRGGTRSGGSGGGKTVRSALSKASGAGAGAGGGGRPNGSVRSPSSYRFRTTLGRRGSQQPPRPLAPVASPWTPREDARPWGWGGGEGGDRGHREDDEDDEISDVDVAAHDDHVLSYGDGGSGGEGTFVSPLSTAGILHRISSSRRSSAAAAGPAAPLSAAAAAAASPGAATTPGSVTRGDRLQHQAGAQRNQWQDSDPGVRESGGGGASSAAATEGDRDSGGPYDLRRNLAASHHSSERDLLQPPSYDMLEQMSGRGRRSGSGRDFSPPAGAGNDGRGDGRVGWMSREEAHDHHHYHHRRHPYRRGGGPAKTSTHYRPRGKAATRHSSSLRRRRRLEEEDDDDDDEAEDGTREYPVSVLEGEADPEFEGWPDNRGVAFGADGHDDEEEEHDDDRGQERLQEERGRHLERHLPYQQQDSRATNTGATAADDDSGPYDYRSDGDDEQHSYEGNRPSAIGRNGDKEKAELEENEAKEEEGQEGEGVVVEDEEGLEAGRGSGATATGKGQRQRRRQGVSNNQPEAAEESSEEEEVFEDEVMDMLSFLVAGRHGRGETSDQTSQPEEEEEAEEEEEQEQQLQQQQQQQQQQQPRPQPRRQPSPVVFG